jgi:hypothetical protein
MEWPPLPRHDCQLAVARDSGGGLRTDRLKIGLCQKDKVQNLSDAFAVIMIFS